MKRLILNLFVLLAVVSAGYAQKNVMWEPVNIPSMDLFDGAGGDEMRPNLSKIEFIKEEKGGHNKKFRIKDGSGKTWVAKLGREARPETAAVRLLHGIGYKTEINYLVPSITIPGKGTFKDVRLEARPDNVERLEEWKWKSNPFVGSKELQGLKIMMVFMTNWDVLDLQNKILEVDGENQYIVSDLGATFGKLGNNNFPIIYRLGRKTGSPQAYAKTRLIRRVEKDGDVILSYKGKNRGVFKGITVEDARWLSTLMSKLSDKQISDAFRAANYSAADIAVYVSAIRRKIVELQEVASSNNLASN
ncbi:MAG: hypothetical protein PSX80_09135 [bacterium]|nr:hypothetical protein [bacterium]